MLRKKDLKEQLDSIYKPADPLYPYSDPASGMLLDLKRRVDQRFQDLDRSGITSAPGRLDTLERRVDKTIGDEGGGLFFNLYPSIVDRLKMEQMKLQAQLTDLEGQLNQHRAADGEYYRHDTRVLQRRVDKKTDKPILHAADVASADKAVKDLNKQRSQ